MNTISSQEPQRVRVLVVEDEMLLAMFMEDTLADFDCEVVGPVARVADGIRLAASEQLDGAILDINVAGTEVFPVPMNWRSEASRSFLFRVTLRQIFRRNGRTARPCRSRFSRRIWPAA